ncbi:hydantoinase B/oxoprolinase family protein [Thermoflavimicrobium dichotomicum]|uniref:N-methylhydantoinase B/acetone carboxylase, alpha subunit n=1 Tax=Thermoflavimicrobium dichotomicum TaxID=46223 RepID=A0A1I3JGW6_9BACL|nr:hydantoinase B/oxoprolinase family protein [Thermoflavimicrobium dichotomicum]SFI59218.1 N-methylhydantoinase B/acetone carboxylase, alpha subunit [Thermoflavimicrobium dichotomicum]
MNLKKETLVKKKGIGWNGMRLKDMLEQSEQLFRETKRYWGIEKLELREKDPIRYERIFSSLRGGLVNARETALNISASPIVKEIGELCFALYTPEGDSIVLSTGIIVHVHTMSDAIKYMIRNNYEENPGIRPGDIFSNNNSIIGDVHTADVHTIVPIFWEGELIGWAGGVTHEIDVGAVTPGSMAFGHEDRYGDGLLLSCEKAGENDEFYQSYLKKCADSVRAERYWLLDERTRLAGCHMIRDQVYRVIQEEGIETYKQFIREVIEEGRRSFKERVKEILFPGTYESPRFTDVPWKNDPTVSAKARRDLIMHAPLTLKVSADGELHMSFEGANKWGYHSFNCAPSPMQGALWVQLTQTLIPNDKINDGAYYATSLKLPYGSWCNPDYEKVSTTLSWHFLIPAFSGMIRSLARGYYARGYLEEISASFPMTGNILQGGGVNHFGVESAFTNFEMSSEGTGAMYFKDGEDCTAAMWNPEGDMGEAETWEVLEPLLYLGRSIKPMTSGPGKYCGGAGIETVRMLYRTKQQTLFNGLADGHVFGSAGIFGGYPGNAGYRHSLHGTNMKEIIAKQLPYPTHDGDPENSEVDRLVQARENVFDKIATAGPQLFEEYDIYVSVHRGGPGLGDVLERDPALVEADLNSGKLLPRYAESIYGVVAKQNDEGKWQVDHKRTAEKRKEMRLNRLKKAVPVKEFMKKERERILKRDFIEPVRDMYQSSMELSSEWREKFITFWNLPEDFEM